MVPGTHENTTNGIMTENFNHHEDRSSVDGRDKVRRDIFVDI
jgi:hypothetical protein